MSVEKFVLIPLSLWESRNNVKWHTNESTSLKRASSIPNENEVFDSKLRKQRENVVKADQNEQNQHVENKKPANSKFESIITEVAQSKQTISKKLKILECILNNPRISITHDNFLILDGTSIGISVVDFLDTISRNEEIPDMYLTILDVLKLPSYLVSNDYAKQEDRGDWISFRN